MTNLLFVGNILASEHLIEPASIKINFLVDFDMMKCMVEKLIKVMSSVKYGIENKF